jgi:SAM-dependent methyltransferase/rhodanese-related sulfurtransferase
MENQETIPNSDEALIQAVHDAYSTYARTGAASEYSQRVAKAFGYSLEELQSIPAESHMGLSCGNPVAAASLQGGEKVLDLGSGAGMDVFLAASKVGPDGQAIGLDMSSDMIKRARDNAKKENHRPPNVAFIQAHLTEPLPITSDSIDCVLSNCVVNLLPLNGKANLLKEVYRVLKPGGRVYFDDIIAKQELPDPILKDLASYVGCVSGAIQVNQYHDLLAAAGFQDIVFVDTRGDLNIYSGARDDPSATAVSTCCSSDASCVPSEPTLSFDANKYAASYQIYALKAEAAVTGSESVEAPSPILRWWDAYPSVQSTIVSRISIEEVASLIRNASPGDYAVIDVRRHDHSGGHVRGSFQWPAQTFYDDLHEFYEKFKNAEKVIFYCSSSNGRGPRCAGWYQYHLAAHGNTKSKAYIMTGGVKAWLEKFSDAEDLVDKDPAI